MAEETKETKKVSFKEKMKKALPWILGGITTVGGSIVAYKLGKSIAKLHEEYADNMIIDKYLRNEVDNASKGIESVIAVMDSNNDVKYAKFDIIDKPDWFDNGSVASETVLVDVVEHVTKD